MKKYYITIILSCILISSELYSQEQLWHHQIGIDGGAAFPFSKYTNNYKLNTGYGFSGIYYFQFSENKKIFFSASAGYYTFNGSLWNIPGYSNSLELIPLELGMIYQYLIHEIKPYWGIEAGMFIMNSVSDKNLEGKIIINEYSFGITPKIGIRYSISENFDFDANLKIIYVFYNELGDQQYYNLASRNNYTHGQLGLNLGFIYSIGN